MAPLEERDPQATHDLRRALSRAGAWLFAVGLLTGLWAGVVLTGKVQVAHPRLALGAHLTAMLGGLEYTRDPVNNTIAALLDLFVVLPALVGAFAWAWGFGGRR